MRTGDRTLIAVFAVFAATTGALLIGWPHTFYANVPGVSASGAFNAHLLRDVGLTYVTLAAGSTFAMVRPASTRVVTIMAATYLVGHAGLHAFMELSSHNASAALAEAPGIYLPAMFSVVLAGRAFGLLSRRSRAQRSSELAG